VGSADIEELFFTSDERSLGTRSEFERVTLTAELELFEPLNGFALVGNDLRLPYQGNGHAAHADNTKDEDEADAGLLSGKAENALKPSHSKESPSTRFDLYAAHRANPSRQAGAQL